jgi:hypothetical protein
VIRVIAPVLALSAAAYATWCRRRAEKARDAALALDRSVARWLGEPVPRDPR